MEGDATRRLSTIIKNRQHVKIKLTCNPRPVEMGFMETMAMGAGADALTAPVTNTTLSNSPAAGAATFQLASNTGLTGAGTAVLDLTPGSAVEEVVTVTTPGTGAGPYTYTIANSGVLKFAHTTADTVLSPAIHTLTDQSDGNYYTTEVSLGGTAGIVLRVRDCKVETVKRLSKAGGLLVYEVELIGISSTVQGSTSTVTLENRQPFLFTQGVWTLDGSQSGDALNVEAFDISQKNNLDAEIQTEQLVLAALIFGKIQIDVSYELVMVNGNKIAQVFFGGTAGTTDSQTMGSGSLTLVFTQADGFHVVTFTITTLLYTKVGLPQPKNDGKHFKLPVTATSVSNMGQNTFVLKAAVQNVQTTAY